MAKDRALLFDLDGTLVDSLPDLTRALNATLARAGATALSLEEARPLLGDGAATMLARGFALRRRQPDDDALPYFLTEYRAGLCRDSRPFAGVAETLGRLAAAGWRLAVVSNKLEALSRELLQGLELAQHFEAIVGGDSYPRRKPDPQPLLGTLAALGVPPQRAAMIGDSVNDVAAARAAGVASILVSFGYSARPVQELGAGAVIERFEDLPAALAALLD